MMNRCRIFGGLCLATFTLTSLAHLAGQSYGLEPKTPTSGPSHHQAVRSDRPYDIFRYNEIIKPVKPVEKGKATKMVAVSSKGCEPCRRLKKLTVAKLVAEGYDATVVDWQLWNKTNPKYKVKSTPTLFYMTEKGKVLRQEVGFKTPEQVKKYLTK